MSLWSTLETGRDTSALLSHLHLLDALVDICLCGFDGLFWWPWNTLKCKHQVCIHKIGKFTLYVQKTQEWAHFKRQTSKQGCGYSSVGSVCPACMKPWIPSGNGITHLPILPKLGRWHEDREFKIILKYLVSSKPLCDIREPASRKGRLA